MLALLTLLAACASAPTGPTPVGGVEADRDYVVMVSFDGLRYDMVDRVETPAFDRLARAGVRASGLIPSYPSKTFPNHYTLATGLYPAHHGLVDNAFYDPSLDAMYRLGDDEAVQDGRWYGGEPIWVTAERQGVRAASFFWVGTEAEIDGTRPSYWKPYDGSVPYAARVDTVLSWLSLPPAERPHLVMLYFSEPDHTGHSLGPDAPAVDSAVEEMDGLLGRLLDGVAALPHGDRVHVIAVSDHGMAAAPASQVLYLEDYADLSGARVVVNSTQALLYFEGDEAGRERVYRSLRDGLEHAAVYRAEETPARWHYEGSERVGDLIVAAEPGWLVRLRESRPWSGGGMHGWSPYERTMHGVFFAAGPGIRPSPMIPAFQNVHVYPLVARLLDLEPAAGIDGRPGVLAELVAEPATP